MALTPPLPLTHFVGLTDRNLAITQAFDLHYASVSRIVRKQENLQREATAKLGYKAKNPVNPVNLSAENMKEVEAFLAAINANDDVQNVFVALAG